MLTKNFAIRICVIGVCTTTFLAEAASTATATSSFTLQKPLTITLTAPPGGIHLTDGIKAGVTVGTFSVSSDGPTGHQYKICAPTSTSSSRGSFWVATLENTNTYMYLLPKKDGVERTINSIGKNCYGFSEVGTMGNYDYYDLTVADYYISTTPGVYNITLNGEAYIP